MPRAQERFFALSTFGRMKGMTDKLKRTTFEHWLWLVLYYLLSRALTNRVPDGMMPAEYKALLSLEGWPTLSLFIGVIIVLCGLRRAVNDALAGALIAFAVYGIGLGFLNSKMMSLAGIGAVAIFAIIGASFTLLLSLFLPKEEETGGDIVVWRCFWLLYYGVLSIPAVKNVLRMVYFSWSARIPGAWIWLAPGFVGGLIVLYGVWRGVKGALTCALIVFVFYGGGLTLSNAALSPEHHLGMTEIGWFVLVNVFVTLIFSLLLPGKGSLAKDAAPDSGMTIWAEKGKRSAGKHQIWLLLYILAGCSGIGLLTDLLLGILKIVKYKGLFDTRVDIIFDGLTVVWMRYFIPTLIVGIIIVLCRFRRGVIGSLASVAISAFLYSVMLEELVRPYAGGYDEAGEYVEEDIRGILTWLVIPAVSVTLLFSFFLPKKAAVAEVVLDKESQEW